MSKIFLCALFLCLSLSFNGQAQNAKTQNLLKQILDLPAPRAASGETETPKKERDAEFLADENVPADDAPIEDLIDYWSNQSGKFARLSYQIKPSAKTVERLLEYSEGKPSAIVDFLNILPAKTEVADKVKQIYDQLPVMEGENNYLRETVNNWLKFNSRYYLDDLLRQAQKIKDQNNYVQNDHQLLLRSLARVDWDSAKPVIDRLINDSSQPYSVILARWVSYEHAMETGDTSAAESWRRELQMVVEDKNAAWAMRDLAMDALVLSGDWDGRADWYISLLEDETLLTIQDNGYTGLTTLISMSKPGELTDAMLKLTKSSNLAARSAAVRNLLSVINKDNKQILEALLPWLTNPAWVKAANEGQRLSLINTYGEADFPEAVPGLIWIVQSEKEGNRAYAAAALAKYKDLRAIPALRIALTDEKNIEFRKIIVGSLVASGGVGDDEQMSSLEAYATLISTPEGLEKLQKSEYYYSEEETEPLALPIIIGKFVAEQEEPGEGLAVRAIERLKVLRRTKPAVAQTLAGIIQKWKGRMIFLEMMRQIKTGEADVEVILNLLAKRKISREKTPNELLALRAGSGITRGTGACLSEDENEFLSVLANGDAEAQTAMLGCARLIRAKLPVSRIGELLANSNQLLALSAERYLETEDSVQARTLVLAKRPAETLILGAQEAFVPNSVKNIYQSEALNALFESVSGIYFTAGKFTELKKTEDNLRAEIKENSDLLAVYAFVPNEESGQQIIRLYKDRAVFTFYENAARYWERTLKTEEYEEFYRYLIDGRIDSLSSFAGNCERCIAGEFIMFGRGGGRRVFFQTDGEYLPAALGKVKVFFDKFGKGDLQLNYRLADKIKGLEVLLADNKFNALAVWKKDADFRVLVEDKAKKEEIEIDLTEREKQENSVALDDTDYEQISARYQAQQKRRLQMQYEHYFWRQVVNGKLADIIAQPAELPFLFDEKQISQIEGIKSEPRAWQVRAGNSEIRVGDDYYQNGLFKVSRPQTSVKIKDGTFANPIVTADGKWVVVSKAVEDWSKPNSVVRVNLQTGKEFKINILPADSLLPVAFIASQNKVLLYRSKGKFYRSENGLTEYEENGEYEGGEEYYETPQMDTTPNPSPQVPEYYLLDAETGAGQLVKGEFRPITQQTYRPLQPTANPNEFWAAIYDKKTNQTQIGRYNDKTFKFQAVLTVPEINLSSMQIWVEEKAAKVYFVYQGHLLGLPLN